MDKFERNSGLFCPHIPLCALKSIPPPAARSPTVAPRGQPARSWRGLWRGSHCPCTPPTRARASSETYGFAARRALATHHTTAESSPAPDETGQNGLPSPLRHTPTWRGSAGDSALSAPAMRPRLIIKAAAGHARPRRRGRGAMEWAFSGQVGSPIPSFPRARERGASGWGRGHRPLACSGAATPTAASPSPRQPHSEQKVQQHETPTAASHKPTAETALRAARGMPRRGAQVRETRRGDGIASRDTVPPDTLIIKTYAKPK